MVALFVRFRARVLEGPFVPGSLLYPQTGVWNYGNLIHAPYQVFVDQEGNVTLNFYTQDDAVTATGSMRVISICTRGSEAIQLPVNILALPSQL